ncbi:MAG: hypothetical protein AB7U82_10605 [Blastocatellales bacterium]
MAIWLKRLEFFLAYLLRIAGIRLVWDSLLAEAGNYSVTIRDVVDRAKCAGMSRESRLQQMKPDSLEAPG